MSNRYTFPIQSNAKAQILSLEIINHQENSEGTLYTGDNFRVRVSFELRDKLFHPILSLRVMNSLHQTVVVFKSNDYVKSPLEKMITPGKYTIDVDIENLFLLNDLYSLSCGFSDSREILSFKESAIQFRTEAKTGDSSIYNPLSKTTAGGAIIFHPSKWEINNV